jgi:hypothetical protein
LYFRRPDVLFSSQNLVEIELSYYVDSLKRLCKCLNFAVNLKSLTFHNCDPENDLKILNEGSDYNETEYKVCLKNLENLIQIKFENLIFIFNLD